MRPFATLTYVEPQKPSRLNTSVQTSQQVGWLTVFILSMSSAKNAEPAAPKRPSYASIVTGYRSHSIVHRFGCRMDLYVKQDI